MESGRFADLELKTIITLTGMPDQKDFVNPRDPKEMAKKVRVTFRPLPRNYNNHIVMGFREKLRDKLIEHGVEVVPWEDADDVQEGFVSKLMS